MSTPDLTTDLHEGIRGLLDAAKRGPASVAAEALGLAARVLQADVEASGDTAGAVALAIDPIQVALDNLGMVASAEVGTALRDAPHRARGFDLITCAFEVDGRRMIAATTADEDRYGDIVDQDTIVTREWEANPILLGYHDRRCVIGTATEIAVRDVPFPDGKTRKALTFAPEFDVGGTPGEDDNPEAKKIARQWKEGILRTVSIGFIPDYERMIPRSSLPEGHRYRGTRGWLFEGAVVVECSFLPIPANPNAVNLAPAKKAAPDLERAAPEPAAWTAVWR